MFVSGVFFLLVAWVIARDVWRKRELNHKDAARAERAKRKLLDRRRNIGGRIYNALCEAAAENPCSEKLFVSKEDDGKHYTIKVEREWHRAQQARIEIALTHDFGTMPIDVDDWLNVDTGGRRQWNDDPVSVACAINILCLRTRFWGVRS